MSSTKLSVSEDAIQAENNLRIRVIELHKDLLNATKKLLDDYAQNQNGLGRHNNSIQELLQDLEDESHDDYNGPCNLDHGIEKMREHGIMRLTKGRSANYVIQNVHVGIQSKGSHRGSPRGEKSK